MKREIKFRYWDSFNEEMRYSQPDEYKDYLSKFFIEHDAALEGGNNPILMQFTGLKDKNGIEIYEGDLIKHGDGHICEVIFKGGCFQMTYLNGQEKGITRYISLSGIFSEVIGNVFEEQYKNLLSHV